MEEGLAGSIVRGVRGGPAVALWVIRPDDLAVFFHSSIDIDESVAPIGAGLPAAPGAASGRVVLTAEDAMRAADAGDDVILVRQETTPDDVLGMQAARGILTARGGLASHAAVVARGWGIPAVVGAADLWIEHNAITVGSTRLRAGAEITIDGTTGSIYAGALTVSDADAPPELDTLLRWADDVNRGRVQVRANADTAADARQARGFGAQGIGLCRTEHMFLAPDRLPAMRRFILADDAATAAETLAELEAAQASDFEALLAVMDGHPVTVRLLDPPLHEFLPDLIDLEVRNARGELDAESSAELAAVRRLHESNPMLGMRGVRLGILRSGLYEMQVRALCTAAATLIERGGRPLVEIMIPLIVDHEELRIARSWVVNVLDEIGHSDDASHAITIGAMVETPRAALTAGALVEHADFFSFGTNDLTQLTYAFSRDDVEARLVPAYLANGILASNPFAELDVEGVGALVHTACEQARAIDPTIKLGACGEHAGHPASIDFLVRQGLDSVSCSPFRVPIARLAVAQSLLTSGRVDPGNIEFTATDAAADAADDATQTSDAAAGGPTVEIDESLVLHVLRVRGFVTGPGFAASLGEHPTEILKSLIDDEAVRYIEARDMYGLLPAGKERHQAILDAERTEDLAAGLSGPYERFLGLNEEFKQLCTDWQVRDGEPNDHTDEAYDQRCIDALAGIAAQTTPVLDEMAATVPRLARYDERLASAASCVADGEPKRFTGVMCESFHDVWMELHEDLIVLQRIDRVAEGSF